MNELEFNQINEEKLDDLLYGVGNTVNYECHSEVKKRYACFRHKNADGTVMGFSVEENRLYHDIVGDSHDIYFDMDDNDIECFIDALRGLKR